MAGLDGSAEREGDTIRVEVQRKGRRKRPGSVNIKILVSFWCLLFLTLLLRTNCCNKARVHIMLGLETVVTGFCFSPFLRLFL